MKKRIERKGPLIGGKWQYIPQKKVVVSKEVSLKEPPGFKGTEPFSLSSLIQSPTRRQREKEQFPMSPCLALPCLALPCLAFPCLVADSYRLPSPFTPHPANAYLLISPRT